jgi:hypothetical protein
MPLARVSTGFDSDQDIHTSLTTGWELGHRILRLLAPRTGSGSTCRPVSSRVVLASGVVLS